MKTLQGFSRLLVATFVVSSFVGCGDDAAAPGLIDATVSDAPVDAAVSDASVADASAPDAIAPDASPPDAIPPDAIPFDLTWTLFTPDTSPEARSGMGLAYDAHRQRTVMFGGGDANGNGFAQTWEWDGSHWTEFTPDHSPTPRLDASMVYDSHLQRVLVFGGTSTSSGFADNNDLWAWDGTDWTQLSTNTQPPIRSSAGIAYDSARDRVVLFAGFHAGQRLDDTWEWNGSDWSERTPTTSPSARSDFSMTYDPISNNTVLFGGSLTPGPGSSDDVTTWTWDGTNWTEQTSAGGPSVSLPPSSMAFDSLRGRIVLENRVTFQSTPSMETWGWDGSTKTWAQLTPNATPLYIQGPALSFDAGHDQMLMFGGLLNGAIPTNDFYRYSFN